MAQTREADQTQTNETRSQAVPRPCRAYLSAITVLGSLLSPPPPPPPYRPPHPHSPPPSDYTPSGRNPSAPTPIPPSFASISPCLCRCAVCLGERQKQQSEHQQNICGHRSLRLKALQLDQSIGTRRKQL